MKAQVDSLNVAEDVELPLAVVGQKLAILGMSGCGKSNAARRLVEQMHRHGAPWVAIDPKGDWHGVRSNRDGSGPGLDVPVLGGDFGDMPLSHENGKRLGELVASGQFRGVLDISDFESDAKKSRFCADFGRALLRNCRTPVMVVCDEAQDYMPQPGAGGRLDGPAAECVNVWKQIAAKGRNKGIGFILCSQRVALLNKTCLYQCETLIAMRVMGARDKAAIKDYVSDLGDATEILKSLSTLEDGEAWIWSPQRLKITRRVKFLLQETFDSGRTPEVGETLKAPKLADVDIDQLRELLGEPDPKEIASGDPLGAIRANEKLEGQNHRLKLDLAAALEREAMLRTKLEVIRSVVDGVEPAKATVTLVANTPEVSPAPSPKAHVAPQKAARRDPAVSPNPAHANGLPRVDSRILTALVQHGDMPLDQACLVAGYASGTGQVYAASKRLREGGLVAGENSLLTATKEGRSKIGRVDLLPLGQELADWWEERLTKVQRGIFAAVRKRDGISLASASTVAGYAPGTGQVYAAAKKLRGLGILAGDNGALLLPGRLR